jgi:hypothetical protein
MKYANHKLIKERGMDPTPQDGDVVEWASNRAKWRVEQGDLTGPQALKDWPDGGWSNVNLVSRDGQKVKVKP